MQPKTYRQLLQERVFPVLDTLAERERAVLQYTFGLGDAEPLTRVEIGRKFDLSGERIRQICAKALRKLRHPVRQRLLEGALDDVPIEPDPLPEESGVDDTAILALRDLVASADQLTPYLISHLKGHVDHLAKLPWDVFEHLVAEFFASWGYDDVRLVGRDQTTAADVFALRKMHRTGVELRYYVEVKRTMREIGVEVIDRVYGAMLEERTRFGWHIGMIVSLNGFTAFRRYSRQDLIYRGIELRDRADVSKWLGEYQPHANGLWLPRPLRFMPRGREMTPRKKLGA